jgi:predicted  nucleic acid-binding Zn-ribbon protein
MYYSIAEKFIKHIDMPNLRRHSTIRPNISTMPRSKTEASEQLELYKKVTKRQRIQQELQLIERRTQELQQQLAVINNEIVQSEETIQRLRQSNPASKQSSTTSLSRTLSAEPVKSQNHSNPYQTFHLEY